MSAVNLLTLVGLKQKQLASQSNTIDFLSIRIGADTLEIKDTLGAFDFSAIKLTNIANGVASTDAAAIGQVLLLSGANAMAGALNMNTHLINNVVDPVSAQDAATKHYTDTSLALKLSLSGGTMTGDITSHNIVPAATSTYNLGASGNTYSNVYADQVNTGTVNKSVAGNLLIETTTSASGVVVQTVAGDIKLNPSTAVIDASSAKISNVATPVSANDAVNKAYADALVNGLSWKEIVRTATTGALPSYTAAGGVLTATANGAITAQDGVTLVANNRLLVKNESGANQPFNGIYVVTQVGDASHPFILTRSSDSNTATLLAWATVEIGPDASTQAGQIYRESLDIATIDVSNVTFTQTSSGISYSFGNGLTTSGSVVSVLNADNSITVAAGGISVKLDPAGALATGVSGVAVQVDNSTIAISSDQIIVKTGGITNTQVSATAAIAYSKLTLTSSIVNSDIAIGAAIAYSKLNLTGSIVNADISGTAAIAYSKLALGNSITASDISTAVFDQVTITGGNGTAAAVNYARSFTNDNAGTITVGQVVYVKSNGHVDLASASTISVDSELGVVAAASIATGASGLIYIVRGAILTGTGFTPGKQELVSTTAGALTETTASFTTGNAVYRVGRALSTTTFELNPEFLFEF